MPLQIDRLIATSIDAQTITSNGAIVGGQSSLFFGEIITGATYTNISSTETIVKSILLPANTIKGIAFPYFSIILDVDTTTFSDLIIKLYVNETPSIDGISPIIQTTTNNLSFIDLNGQLIQAYYASGFPSSVSLLDFQKNKLIVQSQDSLTYKYNVDIFDNFDVSKDLYLIVTAEKIGSPMGVSVLSYIISSIGK
jgi:hypothetical protein